MEEGMNISAQELYEEVVEVSLAEGVNNQEAYNEMVEQVVEDHRRVAELDDDQNLENLISALQNRWPDYEVALNEKAV